LIHFRTAIGKEDLQHRPLLLQQQYWLRTRYNVASIRCVRNQQNSQLLKCAKFIAKQQCLWWNCLFYRALKN